MAEKDKPAEKEKLADKEKTAEKEKSADKEKPAEKDKQSEKEKPTEKEKPSEKEKTADKEKQSDKEKYSEKIKDPVPSQKESEIKKLIDKQSEIETQKILEMSEISIWVDNYDDIFSDFDPRPYSKRSLSDDFLLEAKKASSDKEKGKLELRFLISETARDLKSEATIKKRLKDHFNKHFHMLKHELRKTKHNSIIMAFVGVLLMFAATYIDSYSSQNYIMKFLFVLFEPAGWFITWFALDKIFYAAEIKKSEFEFYEKMAKCEIIFLPY